jgi:hypothetical protein
MAGGYDASTGALELRRPIRFFAPLGWLVAGPLNPAGFLAPLPWNEPAWDLPFDTQMWAMSVAVPLSLGCIGALYYLRDGGVGIMTLFLVLALPTLAACAATGPLYAAVISVLREFRIYWTAFPVFSFDDAIITSGTFMRLGLMLCIIPLVPAVLLLRAIAFRRAPTKT